MAHKGSPRPVLQDEVLYRPEEPVQLFDNFNVVTTTEQVSDPVPCHPYRHFAIYLYIKSTSTPTTLQVKVQFLDRWTGKWYTWKEGPFVSLFWEDTDVASGVWDMFTGMVAGRAMRVTLTGVGTTSSAYFTVSAAVEFWN